MDTFIWIDDTATMRLKKFLEREGISVLMLARQLGVYRSTVYSWLDGKRVPRPRTLAKLTKRSGGDVRYEDFV